MGNNYHKEIVNEKWGIIGAMIDGRSENLTISFEFKNEISLFIFNHCFSFSKMGETEVTDVRVIHNGKDYIFTGKIILINLEADASWFTDIKHVRKNQCKSLRYKITMVGDLNNVIFNNKYINTNG